MKSLRRRQLAGLLLLLAAVPFSGTNAADEPGKSLNLDAHRGKVVLVDFWASWCVPCRQSFPWLNAMQDKYAARGLVVIGVNVDRERADAERFLKDVPARFDIVYDAAGELATHYEVPGMPSTYVFGPDGKLLNKHIGFRNASRDEREAELQKLLPVQAR
jgi:cytochrome c biogenesis protein CcmG/thiol:disulfide interchange protein DsbE